MLYPCTVDYDTHTNKHILGMCKLKRLISCKSGLLTLRPFSEIITSAAVCVWLANICSSPPPTLQCPSWTLHALYEVMIKRRKYCRKSRNLTTSHFPWRYLPLWYVWWFDVECVCVLQWLLVQGLLVCGYWSVVSLQAETECKDGCHTETYWHQ